MKEVWALFLLTTSAIPFPGISTELDCGVFENIINVDTVDQLQAEDLLETLTACVKNGSTNVNGFYFQALASYTKARVVIGFSLSHVLYICTQFLRQRSG